MLNQHSSSYESFVDFLLSRSQLIKLTGVISLYVIVYLLLFHYYPYPDGTEDSRGYVSCAIKNQLGELRPFGYSKFLILVHYISPSARFLTSLQFVLNGLCTLLFLMSVKYIFGLRSKYLELTIDVLSVLSITVLHLTNSILSDSLFTSLTICWVTCGLWFIFSTKVRTKVLMLAIQLIILFLLINVRWTGLFYLGVEFMLIWMVFFHRHKVLASVFSLCVLFIGLKIYYDQVNSMKQVFGIETFSGFSGWQMANNAMHVFPYITLDPEDIDDQKLKEFVQFLNDIEIRVYKDPYEVTAEFIWNQKSPLNWYAHDKSMHNQWPWSEAWTYVGEEVYGKFGYHVMTNHPWLYIKHYLVPNTISTLYPDPELFFEQFQTQSVPTNVWKQWFSEDPYERISPRSTFVYRVSKYLPSYRLMIWMLLAIGIFSFLQTRRNHRTETFRFKAFLYLALFTLGYFCFSAYVAPFVLRYMAPIHLIQLAIINVAFDRPSKQTGAKNKIELKSN